MSQILTSLCSVLLREYFGEIVQKVGTFLMKQVSSCHLYMIVKGVCLPIDKVKSALCVLIQHGFCDFIEVENGIVEYTVKQERVILLLYYERYAYCAHVLYGDPADLLVEEILNHGQMTMSDTLLKVSERLQEAKDATGVEFSLTTIQKKFVQLVDNHFLMRCPYVQDSTTNHRIPKLGISDQELFIVPQINLNLLESNSSEEPPTKKRKSEYPDIGIYWKINHDRYIEYFRNDAIVQACSLRVDEKAAEVMKAIFSLTENKSNRLSPTSKAVAHNEILQRMLQTTNMKSEDVDHYLSVLCEDSQNFVSKVDDRSDGMYVVNIAKVTTKLVEAMAASVVQDRFGSQCARIFRILLSKKILESTQIEDLAMLPRRDCREYIYRLFEENFIASYDLPKGSDFSHGLIFYLLHIDLVQVCNMLLERCYQALFNLITCNEIQIQENKRLLEKKQRIDAIIASLRQNNADEEQIQEVENIITPPEEAVIKKVTMYTQKIDSSQIQIAEMILTLSAFLEYSHTK